MILGLQEAREAEAKATAEFTQHLDSLTRVIEVRSHTHTQSGSHHVVPDHETSM